MLFALAQQVWSYKPIATKGNWKSLQSFGWCGLSAYNTTSFYDVLCSWDKEGWHPMILFSWNGLTRQDTWMLPGSDLVGFCFFAHYWLSRSLHQPLACFLDAFKMMQTCVVTRRSSEIVWILNTLLGWNARFGLKSWSGKHDLGKSSMLQLLHEQTNTRTWTQHHAMPKISRDANIWSASWDTVPAHVKCALSRFRYFELWARPEIRKYPSNFNVIHCPRKTGSCLIQAKIAQASWACIETLIPIQAAHGKLYVYTVYIIYIIIHIYIHTYICTPGMCIYTSVCVCVYCNVLYCTVL